MKSPNRPGTQFEVAPPVSTRSSVDTIQLGAEEQKRSILEHLPQVTLMARRLHRRLPESVNLDYLISAGTMGLIAAVHRFDPSQNVNPKTYAESNIRGAILDSLRRLWADPGPRTSASQIGTPPKPSVNPHFWRGRIWDHAVDTFGSDFSAAEWMLAECGALDNRHPIVILRDEAGMLEVDRILGCIDYGMIA